MKLLIHIIASALTGFIERGSLAGAAIGAVLLGSAAWIIAVWLRHSGLLDQSWIAAGIVLCVLMGLIGAVAGSRLMPEPVDDALESGSRSVLLTDLNHTLIAPFVLLILAGAVAMLVRDDRSRSGAINWLAPGLWVLSLVIAIAALVTGLTTFAVRVGDDGVVFYRLIRFRRFAREHIVDWAFEVAPGKWSKTPSAARTEFQLNIRGVSPVRLAVSPRTAIRLARILSATEA